MGGALCHVEFGDSPKKGNWKDRLKQRAYRTIDRTAVKETPEERKRRISENVESRRSKIKSEQEYRKAVREGKQKAGVRDYLGSAISESREKHKVAKLEEELDPNLKKERRLNRDIKRRDRNWGMYRKFEKVSDAYDSVGNFFEKGKGSGMAGLGLSESDINDLAGLSGSGGRKQSSGGGENFFGSFGGNGGRLSQKQINELAGLSGGSRASGRKSGGKSARRREPKDWGDLL